MKIELQPIELKFPVQTDLTDLWSGGKFQIKIFKQYREIQLDMLDFSEKSENVELNFSALLGDSDLKFPVLLDLIDIWSGGKFQIRMTEQSWEIQLDISHFSVKNENVGLNFSVVLEHFDLKFPARSYIDKIYQYGKFQLDWLKLIFGLRPRGEQRF